MWPPCGWTGPRSATPWARPSGPIFPGPWRRIGSDPEVRAVVVAATGPISAWGSTWWPWPGWPARRPRATAAPCRWRRGRSSARAEILRLQASVTSVADCPLPVIAAIHGYCIGGGVDLIAACDIRLASADAVFSVREAKVAIVADLGSLQRLPQIIGKGHVAELAYTGKDITAERALAIGLVNQVSADADAVLADARQLAAEIAANSPLAVQGTKAVLAAGEGRSVAEGLDYVAAWNAGSLASDDLTEAMAAFMEKRPAVLHRALIAAPTGTALSASGATSGPRLRSSRSSSLRTSASTSGPTR